jgi:hypothetical protein
VLLKRGLGGKKFEVFCAGLREKLSNGLFSKNMLELVQLYSKLAYAQISVCKIMRDCSIFFLIPRDFSSETFNY